MKCEKCGHELDVIAVDVFNHFGENLPSLQRPRVVGNAVIAETSKNWCGYRLPDEEALDTIRCPHCGKFPFENTELQRYEVISLVMFKKGDNGEAVDAVPVVRCKDCLYWESAIGFCHQNSQYYNDGESWDIYQPDEFCSRGERRDDGA